LASNLPDHIDLVLLDGAKSLYPQILALLEPRLRQGALIVADNMIYPGGSDVAVYGRAVRAKPGMSSILVPVGAGLEISRYDPV